APGQNQLQRRGLRSRSILHDFSYAPSGLPVAATSALIWPARYLGFIDAMMRETWNAAQRNSSCENGVSACDGSIFVSLRGSRQIGISFGLHVMALVDRLDAEIGDEADHEQP